MRRLFLLLFWFVELPVAVVGALLLLFWFWSGSDQSLASALKQAGRYLPPGHTLVAEDVRGTLRQGGHIGLLRWEKNGLSVQARQVDVVWRPMELLNRRLQLDTLHVAELTIDDQSPNSGAAPLNDLVLPFQADLAFVIDRLRWTGPPALEANALSGRYRFDMSRHQLTLDRAQVAAGNYQAQATLLARAPMTLDLQVQGKLQAPIGGKSIALDASATLRGPLSVPKVVLSLLAELAPEQSKTSAPNTSQAMRATVSAHIDPWAAQPVNDAQASFTRLDLAFLWPAAPQTQLTGNAQVQPQGNGWQAQIDLVNRLAGPWDTRRVPVDSAKARVEFAADRWHIRSLAADSAGGRIKAQGTLVAGAALGGLSDWQGEVQLQGVNPALLHSQLAPARLDGDLQARAEKNAIVFDARLLPSGPQPAASPLQGLRLQQASAKGRWADGWLQLQQLQLQTDDAQLQGQLDLQLASWSARGQLRLSAPGAQAQMSGQLGAQEGAGDLALQIADAAKTTRWLARLPKAPATLAQLGLQGRGELALHWQGGWQPLQSGRGIEPTLQVSVKVPQLDLRPPGQNTTQNLRLRDLQAELSGRLSALSLQAGGNLLRGTQSAQLALQAQGGRAASGDWRVVANELRLQLQDSLRPGPWSLRLRQPLALDWQDAASGGTLRSGAGEADLTGPLPGMATLAWQPVRWSCCVRNELVSRGQLRGLSMAWLELLGDTQLANLGLIGNLVFVFRDFSEGVRL